MRAVLRRYRKAESAKRNMITSRLTKKRHTPPTRTNKKLGCLRLKNKNCKKEGKVSKAAKNRRFLKATAVPRRRKAANKVKAEVIAPKKKVKAAVIAPKNKLKAADIAPKNKLPKQNVKKPVKASTIKPKAKANQTPKNIHTLAKRKSSKNSNMQVKKKAKQQTVKPKVTTIDATNKRTGLVKIKIEPTSFTGRKNVTKCNIPARLTPPLTRARLRLMPNEKLQSGLGYRKTRP